MRISGWQLFTILIILVNCKPNNSKSEPKMATEAQGLDSTITEIFDPSEHTAPEGMKWIPSGTFMQGAVAADKMAMAHEKPAHKVYVDGFYMDIHEVTNAQFAQFVQETGYVTVAEREIDWEEMKKQLPQDTPKPHDSILQPGSLVFKKTKSSVPNLYDYSQWWEWKIGASWNHPNGPDSDIVGKGNDPVVHVALEDALAYCKWAGRRLPTEAEWEYAARAGRTEDLFFWGNDVDQLSSHANSWEGEFPVTNTQQDGFERRAPVMSYPPNDFGLYDMAGNVWEWTNDWYNTNYYGELAKNQEVTNNPQGAETAYNAANPYAREKVIKGGSFLCSASYCASYRISARMSTSPDSGMEHLGFRTILTPNMLLEKN